MRSSSFCAVLICTALSTPLVAQAPAAAAPAPVSNGFMGDAMGSPTSGRMSHDHVPSFASGATTETRGGLLYDQQSETEEDFELESTVYGAGFDMFWFSGRDGNMAAHSPFAFGFGLDVGMLNVELSDTQGQGISIDGTGFVVAPAFTFLYNGTQSPDMGLTPWAALRPVYGTNTIDGTVAGMGDLEIESTSIDVFLDAGLNLNMPMSPDGRMVLQPFFRIDLGLNVQDDNTLKINGVEQTDDDEQTDDPDPSYALGANFVFALNDNTALAFSGAFEDDMWTNDSDSADGPRGGLGAGLDWWLGEGATKTTALRFGFAYLMRERDNDEMLVRIGLLMRF